MLTALVSHLTGHISELRTDRSSHNVVQLQPSGSPLLLFRGDGDLLWVVMAELPKQPNTSPFISPQTAAGSWAAETGAHSAAATSSCSFFSSPSFCSSSSFPSSSLPALTVNLQTRQQQPAANSFRPKQFLCSSFGGREWPEGLPGTAARRKGKKDLSSGTKVGLCFPG